MGDGGGTVMANLSNSSLTWRGLTVYGRGPARFTMNTLEGWEDVEGGRSQRVSRPGAHGVFDSDEFADERFVTVTGRCKSPAERDALLAELKAVMTLPRAGASPEDLTISHAGLELTAKARLRRFKPSMERWGSGIFGWAAEWVCPDPLRYGPLSSTSTTFPDRQGGLRFPLYSDGDGNATNGRYYGDLGSAGTLSLTNDGTADSSVQFEVAGPVDASGFEIVGSGMRLVYEGAVPAGSVLVIDMATGTVVMDGDSDRTLSWAQFAPVPAGGAAEWSFIALGSRTDAVLTATFRSAWW